ncbi:MAG: hypothetical protein GY796_03130, partial [Chloroflexi bacterium]|nr:hypothetical protein [Chloroflexota bacterium]
MNDFIESSTLSDDIRRYAALLWHWAWLLILCTVLAGIGAYIFTSQQTPIYQASTTLLINQAPGSSMNAYADLVTSERLASTYAELLTKRPVLQGVEQRLGLAPGTVRADAITVQQEEGTNLIDVRVQDTDPERAAQIANAIGIVFGEQNQALQASRYAESKNSLSSQLDSVDQQIQETTLALDALTGDDATNAERSRLQTELTSYRDLYTDLLQKYVLADAQADDTLPTGETAQELSAQLVRVNELIQETTTALDAFGGGTETGLERDRLETNLALYRQIYANLLQSFEQVRLAEVQSSST